MDGHPAAASGSLVVRAALESDVDRLVEIHLAAFPDPRPVEVRRRVFLHNRLGGIRHLRVGVLAGDVVAHAFSFPVGVWFGGKVVRGAAVASVGVAVEARGRRVASALMTALHAEAAARGDAFSLLYPFRQGFYAKLGYAPVAPQRVLSLSPRAIPSAWATAAPGMVRRARADDCAKIARLYRTAGRLGTGFLKRRTGAWEHDLLDERRQWLVLDHRGTLHGYASLTLHQTEPHARVHATVLELVAPDAPARLRLFAALGALGDQVGDIHVALADDDPIDWAFLDADRDRAGTAAIEHSMGVVNTGPMIRLVNAEAALLARGYAVDGTVEFAIDQRPPFTLVVRGGVPKVAPAHGGVGLTMTSETLASVAFGGLRLEDAARLGWLRGAEAAALRVAAPILRVPAFFTLDVF